MIFKPVILTQDIKHIIDVAPVPAVSLYWLGYIPEILASLVSIAALIWYGIRFYEWYKGKSNASSE